MESESEESECFHFFRLHLQLCRLPSDYDLVKTRFAQNLFPLHYLSWITVYIPPDVFSSFLAPLQPAYKV